MRILIVCILTLLGIGCTTHNLLRETPVKVVDLVAIEKIHYADMLTHLLPEGLIIEQRRPPGDLNALYRQGMVQADGAFLQGLMLMMLCCKWKVTGDPEVLALAKHTWDAAHLILSGSGYPGLVARSFGKESPDSPTYVYNRDGSGDGLAGWITGLTWAVKLLDDPERVARTAADLKEIVRHLTKHNLVIHMDENTPTKYGDFNTPVFGVPIGSYAMPMMAVASFALKLNPGDPECEAFLKHLTDRNYPKQSTYLYSWFPHWAFNVHVYLTNTMVALMNDPDERRREYYTEGLNACWDRSYDWQMAFYGLCYKHLGGTRHGGGIDDSIARLRNLTIKYCRLFDEKQNEKSHAKIVPLENRKMHGWMWSQQVYIEITKDEGPLDESVCYPRVDFLLAYWFGRMMGEY